MTILAFGGIQFYPGKRTELVNDFTIKVIVRDETPAA